MLEGLSNLDNLENAIQSQNSSFGVIQESSMQAELVAINQDKWADADRCWEDSISAGRPGHSRTHSAMDDGTF